MSDCPISGIIPPLVTPLTTDLSFDHSAFGRLIDHVVAGGVEGIFVQGTTGEFAALTGKMREEVTVRACRFAAGRVPVSVNITSPSFFRTMELARSAEAEGADFLVLAPPYYYSMNRKEISRYFNLVADRCTLPVILYNAPQYFRNELDPATVKELARHERIRGIKDSSGNSRYLAQLLRQRKDESFAILIGPEKEMGEWVIKGCDGGVNGGANLFPELYVEMYHAAREKDLERVKFCQMLIDRVHTRLYEVPDSPLRIVIALKYALSVKGICRDTMALPLYDQLTEPQKRTIDAFLKEMEETGF